MSEVTVPGPVTLAARPGTIRRLLANPLGAISIAIIAIILIVGITGPWLAPLDPGRADLANAFLPPGGAHLLGTDSAGRDLLSRLLVGAQGTLLAAIVAASVATVIGLVSGLLAGYYAGWFDGLASWGSNVTMSLPSMIVLLAVNAALGGSLWYSMSVLGVLMSAWVFRLTRTAVRSVRKELYVDAARVSGLGDLSIIGHHILFVVRAPLIIQLSTIAGVAIAMQASLEFLGLSDASVTTWGVMLFEGFKNVFLAPWLIVLPAIAISVTIGAFVVFGNALRDALEDTPHVSKRKVRRRLREIAASLPSPESIPVDDQPHDDRHLLSVQGLTIGYPSHSGDITTVVKDISFHVDRGEVVGVVGESGSGKTQTAFAALGLLPDEAIITAGRITFQGQVLVEGGRAKDSKKYASLRGKHIAYIPQEPMSNLDPNFTIGRQLVDPVVMVLKISKSAAKQRVLELLSSVGIPDPERVYRAYPHQISGGMAQRVLIAGAVSCEPALLIADEPTTALDVTVQADVLDLLRDLQGRLQMGVMLVTHNFGVVADLCDRVVVMQHGRVVESGDVRTTLRDPKEPYTQQLLAAMLDGKTPLAAQGNDERSAAR